MGQRNLVAKLRKEYKWCSHLFWMMMAVDLPQFRSVTVTVDQQNTNVIHDSSWHRWCLWCHGMQFSFIYGRECTRRSRIHPGLQHDQISSNIGHPPPHLYLGIRSFLKNTCCMRRYIVVSSGPFIAVTKDSSGVLPKGVQVVYGGENEQFRLSLGLFSMQMPHLNKYRA